MSVLQLDELKTRQRATWEGGDYSACSPYIAEVGELVAARAGITPGMRVLDVACGTGNAARPAARAGARVTGLDLAAKLLEAGPGQSQSGRTRDRVAGGRRRESSVRGRELRPGALDVRTHVRPASPATRTLLLVPGLVDRLEAGIDVLDMGCGQGVAILMMAERFPRSRFVGVDRAAEAIATARAEAETARLTNARFRAQDAATFSAPAAFDFITAFDAIHDQAEPRRVLHAIREALRPGGVFLMVDIAASTCLEGNLDNPLAPFLFTVSTMHCMTVSLAQGGEGLGACWGEEKARELLAEAGFTSVEVSRVEGDPLNAYYVCRP